MILAARAVAKMVVHIRLRNLRHYVLSKVANI
jgi:hypothetical protein